MKFTKHLFFPILFCTLIVFATVPAFSQKQTPLKTKILLIPLDDRPPTLQFTVKMGLIGNAEVVTPPKELLGVFTKPGDSERIIEWVKKQNLKEYDAAVISLDMVAYGGLVAMRKYGETSVKDALKRIEIFREIKRRNPKLPVYAQSVIMRLAPTGDGKNEAWRAKLAEWAEVSPYSEFKEKTAKLENEIPSDVLNDYKNARRRDLQINLKAIDFVRKGAIDYLILSQDDAKPRGIHVADREQLIAKIKKINLSKKIAVQPGADEVAMLLLARSLSDFYNFSPKVKAIYSSEKLKNTAMPFEDRPLHETVSYDIKATGATEVADEKQADLLFYVYASRLETGRAASFAEEIAEQIRKGKRVIVADIDPKGDVQGGDPNFTHELGKRNLFSALAGYASWNTAGNTVGTALPQGVIFDLATEKLMKNNEIANRVRSAQNWFTFHRVLDDYYYHTVVRGEAKKFIAENKWNPFRLSDEETVKVEDFSRSLMLKSLAELTQIYFGENLKDQPENLHCEKPADLYFDLPWNRTFEADIDFSLQCSAADQSGS